MPEGVKERKRAVVAVGGSGAGRRAGRVVAGPMCVGVCARARVREAERLEDGVVKKERRKSVCECECVSVCVCV